MWVVNYAMRTHRGILEYERMLIRCKGPYHAPLERVRNGCIAVCNVEVRQQSRMRTEFADDDLESTVTAMLICILCIIPHTYSDRLDLEGETWRLWAPFFNAQNRAIIHELNANYQVP